jgi:hypothetical protein
MKRTGVGLSLPLALATAGGCKWTDFDDLQEDTWVTATGKPSNDAANWGVAIARVTRSGSNATLAVLGANEAVYNDVVIGPGGDANITNEVQLNRMFFTGSLPLEPLLVSSAAGDEASLVTGTADSRITIIRSTGSQVTQIVVNGTTMQPGAATYLVPPGAGGAPQPAQIVVSQGDTVFGGFFENQPNPPPKCKLVDNMAAAVDVRALASYRPMGKTTDDVLVLSAGGKLLAYDGGAAFNGCGTNTQQPVTGLVLDLGFQGAVTGSQILTFEEGTDRFALVQAHSDGNKGHLGLYKIGPTAITAVGTARADAGVKSAAVFQPTTGGKRYAVAGFPAEIVEGVNAGQVLAFELSTTTGIAATPSLTLFDAQPDSNQAFGRSVAALPFNGKQIITVAADNDVFLYFRTSLYEDTREGR